MDNETYAKKREQLAAVTEVLETDGYKILAKEMERLRDAGTEACCDLTKPTVERDAGLGARKACMELLAYLPALQKSLEATTGGERKTRSTRNSRT